MDRDFWAARISAVKRHQSLQHSQTPWDRLSIDDLDVPEDPRPEFSCPYCFEEFDIATLCSHLEEEHLFESKGVVCPVCTSKVVKDVVAHITFQHGHLFRSQRRRRFRRGAGAGPSNGSLSFLGKELREAHLQVLLGGGVFRSSSTLSSNPADSLLSALVYSLPTQGSEDLAKQVLPSEEASVKSNIFIPQRNISHALHLSAEEEEQKVRQATLRAKFVQQLVLSTLLEDS